MKDAMIIRYPHGWNRGGLFENDYAPAVTTSAWEHNNLLMEIYEEDKDIRIRCAEQPDQGGAEVGYDRNDNDDMRSASCEDRMEIDRDI